MKVRFSSARSVEPDAEKGMKLPYAPSKRVASKWSWYLVLLIVCSPLLYVVISALSSVLVVSEPGHISLGKIEINSSSSGRIAELRVNVGDEVKKGDIVAKLHDARLDGDIIRVSSELNALQKDLNADSNRKDIRALKQKLALAIENETFYADQLDAMKTLFKRRSATRADLNAAQVTLQRAKLTVVDYRNELDQLLQAPEKSIQQTKLEAELLSLQGRDKDLVQRAPADGRVLDVFVRDSEVVRFGDGLALIGEPDEAYAVAYLDPKYTRYARIGQRAIVKLPSGQSMGATVTALPEITHRLPSDFARPLGLRSMKILAHLKFDDVLTPEAKVEGLPVSVRFPFTFKIAAL